ncbi:MAG TPA: acyltransferase [Acidimicrobiales bacterium]|nr:acyltransferase [Acidimicrobiales bacterium]
MATDAPPLLLDAPGDRAPGVGAGVGQRGYLDFLSLFRIVACAAVVAQHSFIWTNMTGNFVGTGFITMLHLSRNSFFFLTGLVVCYSQTTRPRPLGRFWKRRYLEIGVPYLVWTGIYLVFTLVTVSATWDQVGTFLRHNLLLGFSQMYAVIVIFQFYLVFPLLLMLLRSTRRHALVMTVSLAFAALVGFALHYPAWFGLSGVNGSINRVWPWGRDFFVYQEFFVAGTLVALHLDRVLAFVARRYRQIMLCTVAIGILTVLWYQISVWTGSSVEQASDIYEPMATLWCLAAIAGIFSLSWWWHQRTAAGNGAAQRRTLYLAGLTGGIFFSHTLFLNMFRGALGATGLRDHLPWPATVAILFVTGIAAAGLLVSVELLTPLRWVLGGPVRSEQRRRVNAVAAAAATRLHLRPS